MKPFLKKITWKEFLIFQSYTGKVYENLKIGEENNRTRTQISTTIGLCSVFEKYALEYFQISNWRTRLPVSNIKLYT